MTYAKINVYISSTLKVKKNLERPQRKLLLDFFSFQVNNKFIFIPSAVCSRTPSKQRVNKNVTSSNGEKKDDIFDDFPRRILLNVKDEKEIFRFSSTIIVDCVHLTISTMERFTAFSLLLEQNHCC